MQETSEIVDYCVKKCKTVQKYILLTECVCHYSNLCISVINVFWTVECAAPNVLILYSY